MHNYSCRVVSASPFYHVNEVLLKAKNEGQGARPVDSLLELRLSSTSSASDCGVRSGDQWAWGGGGCATCINVSWEQPASSPSGWEEGKSGQVKHARKRLSYWGDARGWALAAPDWLPGSRPRSFHQEAPLPARNLSPVFVNRLRGGSREPGGRTRQSSCMG